MHMFGLVLITPQDVQQIAKGNNTVEDLVEYYMKPYDENLVVPAYKQESYLGMAQAKMPDLEAVLAELNEDEEDAPHFIEDGKIYHWATYNPNSKWDYYTIGGRYNGCLTRNFPEIEDEEATAEKEAAWKLEHPDVKNLWLMEMECRTFIPNPNYNRALSHDQIANNSAYVKDLPEDFGFYALITPDGAFYEKEYNAEKGENDMEKWNAYIKPMFEKYADCLAIGVDYHI
jgi:hypothetical protein